VSCSLLVYSWSANLSRNVYIDMYGREHLRYHQGCYPTRRRRQPFVRAVGDGEKSIKRKQKSPHSFGLCAADLKTRLGDIDEYSRCFKDYAEILSETKSTIGSGLKICSV
jgi:hypothetical protein